MTSVPADLVDEEDPVVDEDVIPGETCHYCDGPAVVEWWSKYYCRDCADDEAAEIDAHRRANRILF